MRNVKETHKTKVKFSMDVLSPHVFDIMFYTISMKINAKTEVIVNP